VVAIHPERIPAGLPVVVAGCTVRSKKTGITVPLQGPGAHETQAKKAKMKKNKENLDKPRNRKKE